MPVAQSPHPSHRRNQSAMPTIGMGPPPAPSSGASGSLPRDSLNNPAFLQSQPQGRENTPRRGPPAAGHTRRHSLALPEARKAAELAQQKRTASAFQFPLPGSNGAGVPESPVSDRPKTNIVPNGPPPAASSQGLGVQRAGNIRPTGPGHMRSQSLATGSGRNARPQSSMSPTLDSSRRAGTTHSRTNSRNFEGNWRAQSTPNNQQDLRGSPLSAIGQNSTYQPGHRSRGSINNSLGGLPASNIGHVHHQSLSALPNQQLSNLQGLGSLQNPVIHGLGGHPLNNAQTQALQNLQSQALPNLSAFQFGNQQFVQIPQILAAQGLAGQNTLPATQFPSLQQNGQMNAQLLAYLLAQQGNQAQQQLPPQNTQPGQPQRKTLFTPYLSQQHLPNLFAKNELVAGILRVNRKNRSDAYVTTPELEADIFICGSKDRNRALEGDLVAVELLDVEEVWSQKREKEEKKKRKDMADARSGSTRDRHRNESMGGSEPQSIAPDGSIRRRGSLRQRPTQKKNDDVEVEGQSLLLVEEDEISDDQKPLFAGHIVAVIERTPGQMFSGTLGLLRPSSQATKEKQEAERQAREGASGNRRHQQQESQMEKPKIVWFKPTDKRVPLIAIPTEQAPADFVVNHKEYANSIFVASIKRWPITSLHPFGTLIERLGTMGDLKVETDALLRDNNFANDEFAENLLKEVELNTWSAQAESMETLKDRRDFRGETLFALDLGAGEMDNAFHIKVLSESRVEIGVHVADVSYFVKPYSAADREAKKRGTSVYLVNRIVDMLPPQLSRDVCALIPGQDRLTVSVVFVVDPSTGIVEENPWVGKSVIKTAGAVSYDHINLALAGNAQVELPGTSPEQLRLLHSITIKLREGRFGHLVADPPTLNLLGLLDDENVPVQPNVFQSTPAHWMIHETSHKANEIVAKQLFQALPEMALLRRQAPPNARRLQTFVRRMSALGYNIDASSSGALQRSLFAIPDKDIREGMETLLIKSMARARYYVAGSCSTPDERPHYLFNLPLYTHFTHPTRRYADIVVHRLLDTVFTNGAVPFNEEYLDLVKTVEHCNVRKECAGNAQEQSVHIESCREMDKKRQSLGSDLVTIGVVICVYESAFDVYIPEYGFEKRVHCDQLPLKKAEFNSSSRVLELYWERGVPSSSYVPEDERPKAGSSSHVNAAASREAEVAHAVREREEAERKNTDTGTISTDDVDALFDDDEEVDEIADMTAGVSLGSPGETQSTPTSPSKDVFADGNARSVSENYALSDSKDGNAAGAAMSDAEKYLKYFTLREVNGDCIQNVVEMSRVPIILKTDMTKSPPYALLYPPPLPFYSTYFMCALC